MLGVQFFPYFRWEKVSVFLAETFNGSTAVRTQPFAVIIQLAGNTGEVEIEDEVSVAAQRGMLPDIKVAKKSIKLVVGTQVVVVLKNVQRQALAETAGTDEEEVVQKRFIRRF